MKADELTTSDRAEATFTGRIIDGDFNSDLEIIATEAGLLVDESFTIPWEWIFDQLGRTKSTHQVVLSERLPILSTARPDGHAHEA